MKLVTVTGCLGLIGSYVTRRCLERGWKVYGIDKCTYAANVEYIEEFTKNENFTFVKEDIVTLRYLPDCDYVIQTNITGVKNLLDLIRRKQSNVSEQPIFFHFSTDEVYGDITTGAHTEEDILKPSNPYSASKAAADMLVLAWARTYGVKYILLRPTNNYGIGQYPEKLIPVSVKMLMRNKKIRLHDEGEPIRNWLHADDTAAAVMTIIDKLQHNKIFNVAGGFEQKNITTVKKIIHSYYRDNRDCLKYVDLKHQREGQDVRYALDDSKLKALSWAPQKNFDEEIGKIVNHYKENFKW